MHVYLVAQSCPTLCNPMDYSPPGSSVHGILQERILEWVVLLQGIFPTQGLDLHPLRLLHCRLILYQLSHKGQAKNYSAQKWHFSPRVCRALRHVISWPL